MLSKAGGKAQGLLFTSPRCVYILERLLTDRLTDLMQEEQDCPSHLQPPGLQSVRAEISQMCFSFSAAESWTLLRLSESSFTLCPPRVTPVLIYTKPLKLQPEITPSPSWRVGGISFLVYTIKQGSAATQTPGAVGALSPPQHCPPSPQPLPGSGFYGGL